MDMRLSLAVPAVIAAFVLLQPAALVRAQDPQSPGAAAFFDDTRLQTIALTVNPRDWSEPR
jgi:hypothetical protein